MDYTTYYAKQAQTGRGESYAGQQNGHGLGTFFTNIFRTAFPHVRDGFIALKDEFLSNGFGLLSDVISKRKPMKESFKDRVKMFGSNLTERAVNKLDKNMSGAGALKRRARAVSAHSASKRRRRTTPAKRTPKKVIKKCKGKAAKNRKTRTTKKKPKKPKKRVVKKPKTKRRSKDIFG
jgi:hypothetical protein